MASDKRSGERHEHECPLCRVAVPCDPAAHRVGHPPEIRISSGERCKQRYQLCGKCARRESNEMKRVVGTARLIERVVGVGGNPVAALMSEVSGERTRSSLGLDDGKKMLHSLAESLHGRGDMHGPLLLDSVKVRREFEGAWDRAREGSREDIELLAAVGDALVALRKVNASPNLKTRVDLAEADLRVIDGLLPRDKAKALLYKDPVIINRRLQELTREGKRDAVNALTRLYGWSEAVDLLVDARAGRKKTGPFPYRRLARELVRPLETNDPETVKKARDAERRAIARGRRPS